MLDRPDRGARQLGIFPIRSLTSANITIVLAQAALFGFFFLASPYLQQVLGLDPRLTGLAFLPMPAGLFIPDPPMNLVG